jgi:hypothetical protein
MNSDQKNLASIFMNISTTSEEKVFHFTKNYCLPQLINLSDLKDDLSSIAYICYYNAIDLIQNHTLLQKGFVNPQADLLIGYNLKKKHLIEHPFPMNHTECPKMMTQKFN